MFCFQNFWCAVEATIYWMQQNYNDITWGCLWWRDDANYCNEVIINPHLCSSRTVYSFACLSDVFSPYGGSNGKTKQNVPFLKVILFFLFATRKYFKDSSKMAGNSTPRPFLMDLLSTAILAGNCLWFATQTLCYMLERKCLTILHKIKGYFALAHHRYTILDK